jgi:hypothetical protein
LDHFQDAAGFQWANGLTVHFFRSTHQALLTAAGRSALNIPLGRAPIS